MRNYHIVLVNGERNIMAERCYNDNGALVFLNVNSETILILAPGTWKYAETENKDS